VVEAAVGADLGAPWIAPLRRHVPSHRAMKWQDVEGFVCTGEGVEAAAARAGLSSQLVIVTDPMHSVRRLDLFAADQGGRVAPLAPLLFWKAKHGTDAVIDVEKARRASILRRIVFDDVLKNSGLGTLCNTLAEAENRTVDGNVMRDRRTGEEFLAPVARQLKGSITNAAKLASKTTILAAPLLEASGEERHLVKMFGEGFGGSIYAGLEHVVATRKLGVVADRRMIVDEGHDDITRLTATMRDIAEVHCLDPYFDDRNAAFESLKRQREESRFPRGFVVAENDERELRLQIADIVAGWARTVIERQGFASLAATFKCVLYGNRVLGMDHAVLLDRDTREHRRLLASYHLV